MNQNRKRKRPVRNYLKSTEHFRRRVLGGGKRNAGTPTPGIPAAVLSVIGELIPGAIRRTRADWVHGAREEILGEFFGILMNVGLSLKEPGYSDVQYLQLLLCKAGNNLKARYPSKKWTSIESEGFPPLLTSGDTVGEAEDAEPTPVGENGFTDPLQTLDDVRAELAKMDPNIRRTAEQVWFEGVPIAEVARTENKSVNAINLRIRRVRRNLSQRLNIPLTLHNPNRRRKGRRGRRHCK